MQTFCKKYDKKSRNMTDNFFSVIVIPCLDVVLLSEYKRKRSEKNQIVLGFFLLYCIFATKIKYI